MKVYKIHNKVFDFNVYWIDGTPEEATGWIHKRGIETERNFNEIQGITIHKECNILYFNSKLDYVILHECIHMIQHILESEIGVDTSYGNTEVLAYNVDWLYREILYRYHKSRGNEIYKTYKT